MSGSEYAIVAYVIGLGLLWGYAAVLWLSKHRNKRVSTPDGDVS